jgi:HEAT repeat protein
MFRTVLLVVVASLLRAQTPVERAWASLTAGVSDKSYGKRQKAVRALGLIPNDAKSRAMAEAALSDERSEVRAAGAESLGRMGASASIPKLEAALRDNEVEVVVAAANALDVLNDPTAFQVYYAILTGKRKSGESLLDSQMKMLKDPKALAGIGIEAGLGFVPFAGAGRQVYKMATKDDSSPVRAAAAQRLVRDPDPKSAEALSQSASDKKWVVRASVVDAIAKRGDPSLLPAVLAVLDDENDTVRFNSAAAVIRLSNVHPKPVRESRK